MLATLCEQGAECAIIAGGDGTLATAAAALIGRDTALGIVPAGTLNHFAQDFGVPLDPAQALEVAITGRPVRVDLGEVNGRTFLNTSALGAYVRFVKIRERWERWLGYRGASVLAAVACFVRLPSFSVAVEAAGEIRTFHGPLVFIGVGERDPRPPKLGSRRSDGQRGLHVMVVKETSRLRLLRMAIRMLIRGIRPWGREAEVESMLVQRCTVVVPRRSVQVAVDGEIVRMEGPLEYVCQRDALTLRVAHPAPTEK
jgi:diacylglycerol kinase family enzyme